MTKESRRKERGRDQAKRERKGQDQDTENEAGPRERRRDMVKRERKRQDEERGEERENGTRHIGLLLSEARPFLLNHAQDWRPRSRPLGGQAHLLATACQDYTCFLPAHHAKESCHTQRALWTSRCLPHRRYDTGQERRGRGERHRTEEQTRKGIQGRGGGERKEKERASERASEREGGYVCT